MKKRCGSCNIVKLPSEFYSRKGRNNALHSKCKKCCINKKRVHKRLDSPNISSIADGDIEQIIYLWQSHTEYATIAAMMKIKTDIVREVVKLNSKPHMMSFMGTV